MAASLLAHVAVAGVNGGTSAAIDTRTASILIAVVASATSGSATLSGSLSNTWTLLTAQSGTPTCQMAYVLRPIVGASHTFTLAGAASLSAVSVGAFGGTDIRVANSTYDGQNGSTSAAYINAALPGAMIPTMTHMLVVTGLAWGSIATVSSVDPAMTVTDQTNFVNLANYGCALAYLRQDVQASINPQWNFGLTMAGSCVLAAFRAAFGGSNQDLPFALQR